jgi:hypothetical protein
MEIAQPGSCERCGTFTEPAGLHHFRGRWLCAACHALERKSVRLWSTTFIVIVGTLSPPAGWILAGIDWWRLGLRIRLLLPVAAPVAYWVCIVFYSAIAAFIQGGRPTEPPVAVWFGFNLVSVLGAVAGLPGYVRAHRAAGGASASRLTAVGLGVLPLFCCVGFYQFYSNPGKP